MTYRRDPEGWAAAMTRAADAAGVAALAERLGVSASRVRQLANPMRPDLPTVEQALAADIAAAREGAGTPHFDAYRRRLAAAGALAAPSWERAFLSLPGALRAALTLLIEALAVRPALREAA